MVQKASKPGFSFIMSSLLELVSSYVYVSFRLFVLQFGCCLILFTSTSQVIGWKDRGFFTSQAAKIASEMTYNMSSGTLNPTPSVYLLCR